MAERLTTTSDKGGLAFTFGLDVTCKPSEMDKILALGEHLKAYEDTGLTPKVCAEYKKFEDEVVASGGMTFGEWAALMHEKQDGRLVTLPCKERAEINSPPQ